MFQCRCGGLIPSGLSRCPNCRALCARPSAGALAAFAAASSLLTACACYGSPTTCVPLVHRGMPTSSCAVVTPDCATPLPDGGSPRVDPTDDFCFGTTSPDGGP